MSIEILSSYKQLTTINESNDSHEHQLGFCFYWTVHWAMTEMWKLLCPRPIVETSIFNFIPSRTTSYTFHNSFFSRCCKKKMVHHTKKPAIANAMGKICWYLANYNFAIAVATINMFFLSSSLSLWPRFVINSWCFRDTIKRRGDCNWERAIGIHNLCSHFVRITQRDNNKNVVALSCYVSVEKRSTPKILVTISPDGWSVFFFLHT